MDENSEMRLAPTEMAAADIFQESGNKDRHGNFWHTNYVQGK